MERIIWLPQFTSFNAIGREFPSKDSIIMILGELKSSQNMYNFCVNNDRAYETLDSKFNPEKYLSIRDELCPEIIPILELYLKRFSIDQKVCEMLGISFPVIWHSICVLWWFNFMVGNYRGDGKQKWSMKLSKMRRTVNNDVSGNTFRVCELEYDPMLEKYPEYKEALQYFFDLNDKANTLSETNDEMQYLFRQSLDIEVKISKILKLRKKGYCPFLCPNPKCRKAMMLSPIDSRTHCGSEECERYYNANSKRKNNLKKDWVQDPSQKGLCTGTCGSKRRYLNRDRICYECYPEKF